MRRLAPALLALFVAAPALAVTFQFQAPIAGDSVPVTVALADVAGGAEITLSIPPGSGDLLGFFGNTTNEAGLPGLAVTSGGVVTQWQFGPANQVWKVGGGNVLAPVKTWDFGLKLGATGSGGGVVETATFTLTGVSVAQLTGASTQGWVFGVRIQSTSGTEGSAKIGLPVGTPPVEDPPSIEITSPADGALVGSQVAVSGTVGGTAPTVTVNGANATVSGATWSTTLTLADGTHTITATATNAAGSASDAITVTVDTTGPLITITAPAAGSLTNQTPVVVSGTVADASSVTSVAINGASFPVSAGAFTGSAPLAEGANTIQVSAVDALGNTGQASVSVTLDTLAPLVTISTPPDGTLTTQAAILVEGSVSDASAIAGFTVNGQSVTLGAGGAFSTSVALASGANPITATATDAAGNTGTASVTATRGSLPTVAIATPAAAFLTNQASALVTGTATNAASVSVNGVAATLTGTAWTAAVPLAEGASTLTATATNAFGSAQASVSGTRDSTPPVVTISSPANGAQVSEATVFVTGTVADASPIVGLTIDGDPITPGASFNVSTALADGANTITVAATDAAGNVGSALVTVTRQAVEPLAVTIASPPDGSLVSQERIAVAGSVSPAGASVVVNGVQATVTGESWTAAAVPLEEGPNTLTATAARASATASDSTGVTLNLPPEISITSPLDGAVLREATTDVEGFVSDALALVDVNGALARVDSGGRFVAEDVTLDAGPNDLVARAIDLQGAQASDRAAVTRDDAAGPAVRVIVGFPYNFNPYPDDPFFFLDDPDTRFVTFSTTDEWLAAMAEIGRPASGFLPAVDLPVVRGEIDSVELFVLTEQPDEPGIDVVFPDGHASDYITSDYQGSGLAEEILDQPFFSFFPSLQLVNPEALTPSDFPARYYHRFLLTRPVDQPDGPSGAPPPYSAPLVIRASQGAGSDSITVFWDEADVVAELASPGVDARVSGATVVASGPAADEHALGPVTYRVIHFPVGFGAVDLGPGEGAISDGRFHIPDAPLGIGGNHLHVNLHDATSWSTHLPWLVERDPSAPGVQLVHPRDGEALVEETATLSLSFGAPLTLVSVNGVPDGRAFPVGVAEGALTLPLGLGPNPIQLEVDAGAGSTFFTFVLYRVATLDPPRITSPAHRSLVNTDTLAVEGVVPLGTPYVEVNGVPGTIEPGGVRFTATIPVPRDLGVVALNGDAVPKPLAVTAVAYPQSTSASIEVTPDFVAPAFRIVLPEDGAATLEEAVAYGGWLSEPATVTLTHAGGEQVLATVRDRAREGQEPFNLFNVFQFHRFEFAPVPVAAGTNTVTLSARDRAGNTASLTLDVERFAAALALTSPTAPVPALATNLVFDVVAPVTLQGMFVNGRFLPSSQQLLFPVGTATIANVPLEPGTNALRLVYSQAGGPQQVLNLAVESSAAGASLLTGTVTDSQTGAPVAGALVQIVIDGQTLLVATDANGVYQVLVGPGEATVTLYAEGYAGGSFTATLGSGTTQVNPALAPTGIPALANRVAILVPPEGAVTDWEQVTVVGTVLNPASSVTVNGIAAEVVGSRFTARHVPLSMGANTIAASASALGSAPASASHAVTRADTPVLDVKIFSPPDGARVPGSGVILRGWVSAKTARTLTSGGIRPVFEGVFVVPDVGVLEGSSHLGALAELPDGSQVARDDVTLVASTGDPAFELSASRAVGVAPLTSQLVLRFGGDPFPVTRIDFDLDGDLEPEIVGDADGLVEQTYTAAGPVVARALVTTPSGVELSAPVRVEVQLPENGLLEFAAGNPVDLAPGSNGGVFVLDGSAGRVSRYDGSGQLVSSFGSAGVGPESLLNPRGFSIAPDGRIYVADTGNDRIQVFAPDGTFEGTFGSGSATPPQIDAPTGVHANSSSVVVAQADRVQLFDLGGRLLRTAPIAGGRGMAEPGMAGVLIASPNQGLLALGDAATAHEPAFVAALPAEAALTAPIDVAESPDAVALVDGAEGKVVLLSASFGYRRTLSTFIRPPLAVLPGARRETPSVYVADGVSVREIELPVVSPLPTFQAFRSQLAAGDATGALALVDPRQRALFAEIFATIAAHLPSEAAAMSDVVVEELREDHAVLVIRRPELQGGTPVVTDYPVLMQRTEDGQWWIYDF